MEPLRKCIKELAWHTSGGVLKFISNTGKLSVKATLRDFIDMDHMPRSGSSGFDFYLKNEKDGQFYFYKNIRSIQKSLNIDDVIFDGKEGLIQEWKVYFPLYCGVETFQIGIQPGAFCRPVKSSHIKPVAFYGSSITQGGCASRPGNSYPAILSRWLDFDIINLGFSGSAKGEPEMAAIIADLDISAFVMDYDHNAPNPEHLEKTHDAFFQVIRSAKADLPVIFITRPPCNLDPNVGDQARRVILKTFEKAQAAGDRHVYFIDGSTLFGVANQDACTVDGGHPNDLGFMRMAEHIYPVLKPLF
jgi:lysophospholipase L1-like esterase